MSIKRFAKRLAEKVKPSLEPKPIKHVVIPGFAACSYRFLPDGRCVFEFSTSKIYMPPGMFDLGEVRSDLKTVLEIEVSDPRSAEGISIMFDMLAEEMRNKA